MKTIPSQPLSRRTLLKRGLVLSAGAMLFPIGHATAAEAGSRKNGAPLREKFFGCIAGVHIGSSMAAPVEGWSWDRIERQHGTLQQLLTYEHYGNGWKREPGTTEDGVERQKLMITAIIEKQDRINAEDLRRAEAQILPKIERLGP